MCNKKKNAFTTALLFCLTVSSHAFGAPSTHALAKEQSLGLYPADAFKLTDGKCKDCITIPQALWYFHDEIIAVPNADVAGFEPGLDAQDDVRNILGNPSSKLKLPPLVWIGSPAIRQGILRYDSGNMQFAGSTESLSLVNRILSNRSYFNTASARFFDARPVLVRGIEQAGKFVARSLWPLDYSLNEQHLAYKPLGADETISSLVHANEGGARSALSTRLLWRRSPNITLTGKPVIGFILNGAQGDDDESLGGHFAVATGKFGPHGEWNDWLVNNFYDLSTVSEKGIIAAPLPLDAYQADLNSGQSWYRPSYLLVAVLKNERSAALYQQVINRVYNHFYRQDFLYRHADANCAGISMNTLRTLGWHIPERGPTSRLKAFAALPYKALEEGKLESGLKAYDYLITEQTDLLPFSAFDAIGEDLLGRIAKGDATGYFEKQLAQDLEAVIFIRLPQFPSSRAWGQAPVASMAEYMARVPDDRSKWKIVPVGKRAFPETFKQQSTPAQPLSPARTGLMVWLLLSGFCILVALFWIRRKRARPAGTTIHNAIHD